MMFVITPKQSPKNYTKELQNTGFNNSVKMIYGEFFL